MRPVERWLYFCVMTAAIYALGNRHYWDASFPLDWVLAGVAILVLLPWLISVAYRDYSWRHAYHKGRITKGQYLAYRANRTGWPSDEKG
jgi:hypothetical protein